MIATLERVLKSGWCLVRDHKGCARHPLAVAHCNCPCHSRGAK